MRAYHYFTLAVGVLISLCAAYYSIIGLTAIFAAATLPIIIMGASLELAKITGAVWLKLYWTQATWWIKMYLVPAVAVLMLITSMGIFGFLSKAHIEQTASAAEGAAQIERIDNELARLGATIDAATKKIDTASSAGSNADAGIQAQIDTEQSRLDSALARLQPAIDEQNAIITNADNVVEQRVAGWTADLAKIDGQLAALESALASGNVEAAQTVVGVRADGNLGPATQAAITEFRAQLTAERAPLVSQIDAVRTAPNPTVDAARAEIARLRAANEAAIAAGNSTIEGLRAQLGKTDATATAAVLDAAKAEIAAAEARTSELTSQRYELEATARKLAAEVGPIKYVAELIYGEADTALLEKSVRWMILLLVLVFDPLALILTLAAITGLSSRKTVVAPEVVEKLVEVPVDRIVEVPVDRIVEVPVDRVVEKIVEVPVEDTERVAELAAEVAALLDTVDRLKADAASSAPGPINQPEAPADFDLDHRGTSSFGSTWPDQPVRGDLFLKVDITPNKLYKWNGKKWIEIDRGRVDDTLVYDEEYIRWLIEEIKRGRREFEELTDMEQSQVKTYIVTHGNE